MNTRNCINKVAHAGYCLFQVIACVCLAGLFALIGIYTAMTSAVALCRSLNYQLPETILIIMILLGGLSGASFFFGVLCWLPSTNGKRRWRRAASILLPLMSIITLIATVKCCIYSIIATRVELDEFVIGSLAIFAVSSLASFGQYALATYIVYSKMRTDPLRKKQRIVLPQIAPADHTLGASLAK